MNEDNLREIRRTLEIFKPNNLTEIRGIKDKLTFSGYFRDIDKVLDSVKNLTIPLYFVLNEIDGACYSKEQRDKIVTNPKSTTKDKEIVRREWILIDADPKRASDISDVSASNEEKSKAKKVIGRVYNWLKEKGFSEPVIADSGNGYHLLYRVGLKNEQFDVDLVKNFLKVIDMYFSDEHTSIDTAVFNASRITKLYGTVAQKGANTPERPHRMSKITYVPKEINTTGYALIEKIISDALPKPEPKIYNPDENGGGKRFDLYDFMAKNGIISKQTVNISEGKKIILEQCVFDPSHKGKDAAIFHYSSGAIHYHCFHSSCSNYQWRDVRLKFEPDAYDKPNQFNGARYIPSDPMPNYRKNNYTPLNFEEIMKNAPKIEGTDEPEPEFYTTEQIRNEPDKPEEFIETGITAFDRRNRGFCKGEITCISGETGSGKSSLVSMFALEAANREYKVALFSGELKRKRVYKWLIRQAAGKKYIRPTQYDNYFIVNEECEEPISKWLDDKIYIYNNNYGNIFTFIKNKLNSLVSEKRVDLIILDNLMSMNIDDLSDETNKRQTAFVEQLKQFAETNDVHVAFVAHPKKPDKQNLIGQYDVCGSSNIVNFVDNILIIYRTSENYKKLKVKEFSKDATEHLDGVGNELRICKDRSGGELDLFVPLYFEKESKRLKNSPEEIKVYGWQNENRMTIIDAADDPNFPFSVNQRTTFNDSEDDLPIM